MNSFLKIFIFSSWCIGAFAANELPKIPTNCFQEKSFCYGNDVVDSEEGRRVIRVSLIAKFDNTEYTDHMELVNKFFDFAQWPVYAEDSQDVKFFESRELDTLNINGKQIRRHLAHYETGAPFPFRRMEIFEVANYYQISSPAGAFLSYKFVADMSNPQTKGIKYKVGILHLAKLQNNDYLVYLTVDVIPAIDLLPKIAAPYIEKAMMGIFTGMFNLR